MSTVPQTYYVYILTRPDKKLPQGKAFYVGKGTDRRIYHHDSEARSGHKCHKCSVIRKVWREGGQIQRYIIFTTNDEKEALAYEIETIALYGRENLTNGTDGGDGASGYKRSAETQAKMRAINTGRRPTAESLEKMRAASQERWADPQRRAAAREKKKAEMSDPAARARYSQAVRAKWNDPEYRAKQSVSRNTPEYRAKQSAMMKAERARRKASREDDS